MKFVKEFSAKMAKRANQGAKEYGNSSFLKLPLNLIDEIEEELVDVSVWSAIVHSKMEALKYKILAMENLLDEKLYSEETENSCTCNGNCSTNSCSDNCSDELSIRTSER